MAPAPPAGSRSGPKPHLLGLPLELRQQIYSYLLPKKNTSHPLPGVGLTQVSHPPPTSSLLNIHPQITDEVLRYFYHLTTWTLVFSHAFNFFRTDPNYLSLERSYLLRRIRKLECVVFCDVLLLKSSAGCSTTTSPSGATTEGLAGFCAQIKKRIHRATDVLMRAEELRQVTVVWVDSTGFNGVGDWEAKARILAPLRRLKTKSIPVAFQVGRMSGVNEEDREAFAEAIRVVLGDARENRSSRSGCEEAGAIEVNDGAADAAKLRMLALDPKQNREVHGSLNQERFARVARSNAVTGAGVWRTGVLRS